eukprot:TRINITY_DN15663_c0_g1_i2.p1 TRINITY_DN15663_c0_g1~~TRINITY_DN15663_c0_g1_i2.p1  ORF type:complete len:221 (+),score=69.27 TRINITY_DN15663_c0_g1_i2:49-663(+)
MAAKGQEREQLKFAVRARLEECGLLSKLQAELRAAVASVLQDQCPSQVSEDTGDAAVLSDIVRTYLEAKGCGHTADIYDREASRGPLPTPQQILSQLPEAARARYTPGTNLLEFIFADWLRMHGQSGGIEVPLSVAAALAVAPEDGSEDESATTGSLATSLRAGPAADEPQAQSGAQDAPPAPIEVDIGELLDDDSEGDLDDRF